MAKWTEAEKKIVELNWPKYRYVSEFKHLLPNRSERAIDDEARRQKLVRNKEHLAAILVARQELLIKRNKTLGRDISYNFAKQEIARYKSLQEFRKCDPSLYTWCTQNKVLKELTEHMILGDSYTYPQNFLYECAKQLYPNMVVRFNDRTAIKPKEIDVFVPELKLGFEYDGKNFHTTNSEKSLLCEKAGIKLLTITEENKRKPEECILSNLHRFGFHVDLIDVPLAISKAFQRKMTFEDLKQVCLQYDYFPKFSREQASILKIIKKLGKLDEYTSHMKTAKKSMSKVEILEFIKTCTHKNQVYKNLRLYLKIKKLNDQEINSFYDSLISLPRRSYI